MIRINKITVRNYKNIQVKDLELTNFNLVVGPNNSGKSNFMQVFSFINYIINGSADEIDRCFKVGDFGIYDSIVPDYFNKDDSNEKRITFIIELEDTNSKMIYIYHLELEWKYSKEEKNIPQRLSLFISEESFDFKNKHTPGPLKNILKRLGSTVNFGDLLPKSMVKSVPDHISAFSLLKIFTNDENSDHPYIKALKILDSILKSETYYFSHTDFNINEPTKKMLKVDGKTVSYNLIEEIVKLKSDDKLWEIFRQSLNQILKIESIEIIGMPFPKSENKDVHSEKIYYVFFHHFNTYKQIAQLSDGTRLLIALLVKILSVKNELILIEEPENSLHPKALIDLINFFRSFENEKQFILNTHSIALINMITPENVIIATCNNNGSSTFSKVSNINELKKRLKRGHIVFSDAIFFGSEQDEEEKFED